MKSALLEEAMCYIYLHHFLTSFFVAAAESGTSQSCPTAPHSGRRPANVLTTTPSSTVTPSVPIRRSSLTTSRVPSINTSKPPSRADTLGGGSPRPVTAPNTSHGLDATRPNSSAGVLSATNSHDFNSDSSHGDTEADAPRIESTVQQNRAGPTKDTSRSADSGSAALASNYFTKPTMKAHAGIKEDDISIHWNGARSASYRRSASFDIPLDNSLGRSQSFSGVLIAIISLTLQELEGFLEISFHLLLEVVDGHYFLQIWNLRRLKTNQVKCSLNCIDGPRKIQKYFLASSLWSCSLWSFVMFIYRFIYSSGCLDAFRITTFLLRLLMIRGLCCA